jgi:ABC-2 type transport system permease protein
VSALATLTRVEASLVLREPAAVLFTLGLPLLLLALNSGQGNAPDPDFGGVGILDVLLPGLLVYVIATLAVMSLPETLADYRDRGILRRYRVTPLRPWQIVGAHACTHLALATTGAALVITVGLVGFDLTTPRSWLALAVAFAASAACLLALGFLLGAVLPTVRTTQAVASGLYFPAIFLSGAVWPTEALPELARTLGNVLPLTYAVDALREAWSGGTVDLAAVGVLVGTAAVSSALALRLFRWEPR